MGLSNSDPMKPPKDFFLLEAFVFWLSINPEKGKAFGLI
jgi:hypothetical protein